MTFRHIGYLQPFEVVILIPLHGEEIEHMLDVFDGIDMPVDIHIIIIGVDGAHNGQVLVHLHPRTLGNGTFYIRGYPFADGTVVDG